MATPQTTVDKDTDQEMTVGEAAKVLGVPYPRLRYLVMSGKIPVEHRKDVLQTRGHYYVRLSDIQKWINSQS